MKTTQDKLSSEDFHCWILSDAELSYLNDDVVETLFSVGNGTLGTRGTSGYRCQDLTQCNQGTFINGAFVKEKIEYDESAFGFAQFNNKMLQVKNTQQIEISMGSETFVPIKKSEKKLNLKHACYDETLLLATSSGKKIKLDITRFISQQDTNLMINRFSLEPLNCSGMITIKSFTDRNDIKPDSSDDPRVGNLSLANNVQLIDTQCNANISYQLEQVNSPNSLIITALGHQFEQEVNRSAVCDNDSLTEQFEIELDLGGSNIVFTKYSFYSNQCAEEDNAIDVKKYLINASFQSLTDAKNAGFENLFMQHKKTMNRFWCDTDIKIAGNEKHQKAIRLNMLHLHMSAGQDGKRNIAAKGLTGPGYDGHYFWDSEIYITPYFIYTQPEVAKSLLSYRYNHLAQAKQRAREMGHETGALFPWRTIGGEECSSYFPAGTAQYHINAAIAYAVKQYFKATADWQFMLDMGAELVVETARLWISLGHFNDNKQGLFCLDTVTGPDEYTALVNNNYYTNAMAKIHLSFAHEIVKSLKNKDSKQYELFKTELNISEQEIENWISIAKNMYLPHDGNRNITPQDDSFLNKKQWDFAGTAKDKYPLLLNFHPLVIYRHQVLKQADVILANFLQDDEIELDLKRNNLDFYEPITTHDSTLSACTHSIAYSEIGEYEKAYAYFNETVLTDLDDLHNNSHYGIHTAAMAGSWMCVVHGFAGFRMRNNYASFNPKLPTKWQALSFKLKVLDCQIQVSMTTAKVSYKLLTGEQLALKHQAYDFLLSTENSIKQFKLDGDQTLNDHRSTQEIDDES